MNLNHVKDTLIGDTNIKGISGGQLKRVSIAVEIIDFPEIIFLDEPTSGLDSNVAFEVMSIVKKLSLMNRSVMTIINQPSPEIFALFDKVVLMQNGKLIYFGNTNGIVKHFTSPKLLIPYEEGRNVAEYLIEAATGVLLPSGKTSTYTNEYFRDCYYESEYFYKALTPQERTEARKQLLIEFPDMPEIENNNSFPTNYNNQVSVLLHRTGISIIRDRAEIFANIFKNILLGLLMGIVYFGQADISPPFFNDQGILSSQISAITSLLYFAVLQPIVSTAQSIPYLVSRMGILRKETAAGSYSFLAYWLVLIFYAIPQLLIGYVFFIVIAYFMIDYPAEAEYFFYFFIIIFLGVLVSYYFAMALAAAVGTETGALAIFPLTYLFFNCFAGYTVTIPKLPWFWKQWAHWISYIRWGFQGLMVNQFSRNGEDGQVILRMYDFDNYNKWNTVWIICIFIFIGLVLIALAMRPPRNKLAKIEYEEHDMMVGEKINPKKVDVPAPTEEEYVTTEEGNANTIVKADLDAEVDVNSKYYNKHPQNLVFRDLYYTVSIISRTENNIRKDIQIIKGVNGEIKSGQMCALMGASGAGKSTLLDILAFRKTTGEIVGEITLNKVPVTKKNMVDKSAYVMQDCSFHWMLTVRETLKYAAFLRLPKSMSEKEKEVIVDDTLKLLGLYEVRNTLIGNELVQGISGSQKKRLSIGVEIIHSPQIIFLDEPTTGLDSAVSLEVIETAKRLARLNRTVISTIHQPSPPTFALFDTLIMMANGRIIYNGTVKEALPFFTTRIASNPSQKPLLFPYVQGSNPADFIVSIASTNLPTIDDIKITEDDLINNFTDSDMGQDLIARFTVQTSGKSSKIDLHEKEKKSFLEICKNSYYETIILFKRLALIRSRYRTLSVATIIRSIIIGVLYGTLFYDLGGGTTSTVYTSRMVLFFFSLMVFLMVHQQDIPDLINDRVVYYRERGAGIYGVFPYWLSRLIYTTIISAISVFCFCIILYLLTGLRPGVDNFLYFYYNVLISDVCSYFFAVLIACCSPTSQFGLNFFPTLIFLTTSFQGFVVLLPDFPAWIRWGNYLSFLRYPYQALVINELTKNKDLPLGSYYIENMEFDQLDKDFCASITIVFLFGYGYLSYLALKYISFEKR